MDSLAFDVQRSINLYPITSESGTSVEPAALRSVAGYIPFATVSDAPSRGQFASATGRAYYVAGSTLYEVFSDGATVDRGALNSFTERVGIAENNAGEIMITDGVDGYIFDQFTNTFAQITDPAFPAPTNVTYQDGYFIVGRKDSNEYYISGINNGLSWDALDFGTAESEPDDVVSVISDNGNLWIFCEFSLEVHSNTGAADFPFARISGAVTDVGCAAPFTVETFDNTLAWLGVDRQGRGVVWKGNGYTAQRISTQAIESKIAESEDFTDSFAYVYHEQGHVFYCLQVRGVDTTLVFDAALGVWHERAYFNPLSGELEQHRAAGHMFFAQKNIVMDRLSGALYDQSLDYYDFAGDEIFRRRIMPHIFNEGRFVTHSQLEIDMETGVGVQSGQGSDPEVMLRYSDDGGRNWSAELWRSAGKVGDYRKRVRWQRLGIARDRVYEITMTEPVFVQFNGAYLNAS